MAENTGFAGLPYPVAAKMREAAEKTEPHYSLTLPKRLMGPRWEKSDFEDKELKFAIIEMTADKQDRAVQAGGQNTSRVGREMMKRSIYMIGDERVYGKGGMIDKWFDAIGARGMRCVEAAWIKLNVVEEDDVDSFLETLEVRD